MTRGMRLLLFLGLTFIAALVLFASTTDTRATPPPFSPGGIFCFENFDTPAECDGDPAPGANPDVRNRFCIGWNDDCTVKDQPVNDSNFGPLVSFVPEAFGVPKGDTIPIGAVAGSLSADSTLGLLGGACNSQIGVNFSMMNASININDTISPKPQGESNVMEPLAFDANPQNGIPDGVDHYPSYLNEHFKNRQPRLRLTGVTKVQGTWVVLNFVFFDPGATLKIAGRDITFKPELGYVSQTVLQDPTVPAAPGTISDFCAPLRSANIVFGATKDNPCTGALTGKANCPVQNASGVVRENGGIPFMPCETGNTVDEDHDGKINDGCPQVNNVSETGAQCDNDTSDDGEDSSVNDGCPAVGGFGENARYGSCSGTDEGNCVARLSPSQPGTYTITMFANSQRDADGDGFENGLDVCFDKPNPQWDPRAPDGGSDSAHNDADKDGLPVDCDPNPNAVSPSTVQACPGGLTGPDEDQDCFSNRLDNCPLVSQLDVPGEKPSASNKPKNDDRDSDGIGDKCDPNPDAPDGDFVSMCMSFTMTVGAGASTAPAAPSIDTNGPACIAATAPAGGGAGGAGGGAAGGGAGGGAAGGGAAAGGVGGAGATGVGSLAPTGTSVSWLAIAAAAMGAVGVAAGLGIISARRAKRRE